MKYLMCISSAFADQFVDNMLWRLEEIQPVWGVRRHGLGAFVVRILWNILLWELSITVFTFYAVGVLRRSVRLYARFEWNIPADF